MSSLQERKWLMSRRKPLIGNLPDIPPKHSWLKFKEWADQYGPIFRLNLAGREHYVVSKEKIANDLLRERGNIYSSREQLPAAAVLLSRGLRPVLLPYDDVWRNGRRLMHLLAMPSAAATYEPTQAMLSTWLLENLIRSPTDYEQWIEQYSSGLMLRLAFGRKITTGKEPEVRRIYKVLENLERIASPGAYLVDTFPSLMMLPKPLAPFKQELEDLHQEELSLFRKLRDDIRVEIDAGTAPDCWEKVAVEKEGESGLTPDQLAYVIGTMFEAGSGTTAAGMMSFLLCMVLHPEEQRKVHEELDRVIGSERLPQFADMPDLPYVRATMKETLRWRPVTAGGVPHLLTKDDVYNGTFIPAGTNIHANQWAIHRDPELYPEPETFKPERWLDPKYPTYKEPLSTYPNLQGFSAFGFGRRICPGLNIAERSLFLLIARIAWACEVKKKTLATGEEEEVPLYDYTAGFNAQPKWFPFDLKVRGDERLKIANEEAEMARERDPLKGR
ncbi:cytochrome P450 [Rhizodiscina lignyota]|uniref:Cytochrome P450 n=1 Tax=Rhizodiscina lignyota TaxID=1504668 RepID=A0A9P4M5V9_9PEZI|nr:cytochrome P450 [Rhizodiscina lignyota]